MASERTQGTHSLSHTYRKFNIVIYGTKMECHQLCWCNLNKCSGENISIMNTLCERNRAHAFWPNQIKGMTANQFVECSKMKTSPRRHSGTHAHSLAHFVFRYTVFIFRYIEVYVIEEIMMYYIQRRENWPTWNIKAPQSCGREKNCWHTQTILCVYAC